MDDGSEIYIDSLNDKSASVDADDYTSFSNINNLTQTFLNNQPVASSQLARIMPKTGGYTMEIQIPWASMNTAASLNKTLGLLLANNDRDNGIIRQFDWQNLIS